MQDPPSDGLDDLYRDVVLKHYRESRSKLHIENPDIEYDEYNPICGDRVVLQLKLDDGRVGEAGFHGEGCSISQASASMMTGLLCGKSLEEAERLSGTFRRMMHGSTGPQDEVSGLGDLEALQGVRKFPVRIKCALLAWTALEEGIEEYRARANQ
jgi:nitrogen fixation NifU-like protein